MPNTTAGDIINKAFKKVGVDTPDTDQDAEGLDALNNLLLSWSIEGLVVPFVIRETFTLTVGDAEYTIGSGADFNTVRPFKISDAYLKDGTTSYPLNVSPLKEYNDVVSKANGGRPKNLYYLSEIPEGKILFDLEPDVAYTLHLDSWKTITEFALTTTTIASILIPNEYKRALIFNLAIDLSSDEDYQLSADVFTVANESKEVIRTLNASNIWPQKVRYDRDITYSLGK